MAGQPELAIDLLDLPSRAVVCDAVYVPLKTKLLAQAEAAGGAAIDRAVIGRPVFFVDDDPVRDAKAEAVLRRACPEPVEIDVAPFSSSQSIASREGSAASSSPSSLTSENGSLGSSTADASNASARSRTTS